MSDPEGYMVGWICALPVEYIAAQEFLDEEHDKPSFVSPNDDNDYTLGKMGEHNVVIAVMPDGEYGTASAASVATNMLNSFHNIRIGLMVGIGGGVPSETHDIRLGDVVVSAPRGGESGVFQYDFGKSIQGQEFQYTRFLNQPPTTLRTAMTGIQAQYQRKGHKLIEAINVVLDTNIQLRSEYERPESSTDRLFQPSVNHESDCGATSCANNASNWLPRRERSDHEDNPAIHYGLIASANQLMKDALIRDRLAAEKDVLCFEMEAAGLMNNFPCLVIRGICDYSDSHKNKAWQGHAAMVAAAYTKDLLQRIPLNRIEAEERISAVVSEEQKARVLTDQQRRCYQVFKVVNYAEQKNINPKRAEGTCRWAFQSSEYIRWFESNCNDLLWVSADPGCGKSVLARSIVDDYSETSHPTVRICYFFFKNNDEQNNVATALCSVLHQLFSQQSDLLKHAIPAWEKNGRTLRQEVDELWRILMAATSADISCKTICIFDALDECRETDQRRLIEKLQAFHRQPSSSTGQTCLKFLVTSRPYYYIQDHFRAITDSFPHIHIKGEKQNDQIHEEIDLVVRARVRELAETVPLSPELHYQVEKRLLQMEHRTYLWLHLAIDDIRATLEHSIRPGANSITLVPSSVNAAYEKILCQVPVDQMDIVKKVLEIIVAARRPLTIQEMAIALGISISSGSPTTKQAWLDPIGLDSKLRRLCGQFVFTNNSKIYLIHQTAREFLIAKDSSNPKCAYWNSLTDAEDQMAKICLQYLSMKDSEYDEGESGSFVGNFLEYSAAHWPDHVRNMPLTSMRKETDRVHRLYDMSGKPFSRWFPIFWKTVRPYGKTPVMSALHLAAFNGHEQEVHSILSVDQNDVNAPDDTATYPVMWASLNGYDRIVELLLERGADVNAQGGEYGNALQAACARGHGKIAQMLLERGADVNAQGGEYGNALQAACAGGHGKIAQMLLERGADVNAQGGHYGNSIQAACLEGQDEIMQILLKRGAGANAQGEEYEGIESMPQASIFDRDTRSQGTYPSTMPTSESPTNVKRAPNLMDQVCAGLGEEIPCEVSDDESIYSSRTDIASAEEHISRISDVLLEYLEADLPDVTALNRISDVLGELLKAFAIQLEFEIKSQVARDAMVFIRHYRQGIAVSFQQKWHARQIKNREDVMSNEEIMHRYFETISEDLEPPVTESDYDHGALALSSDHDITANQPFFISAESERPIGLNIDHQHLVQSRAFRWLLSRLQGKLHLVTVEPDNISIIREKILGLLPSSGKVSRSQSVKTFKTFFNVDWDVLAFVTQQKYCERADEAIATAICLTGGPDGAQATTTTQYLDQTWPLSGRWILQALKSAVLYGTGHFNASQLGKDLEIVIYLQKPRTLVEVYGTADFIAEVGEQIAWLGSALRSSSFDRGVAFCTPFIHKFLKQPSPEQINGSEPHSTIHCKLGFHVNQINQQPLQNGICWHGLFNNPLLVQGFPILSRANNNNGLEIPLHMMASLVQARRVTNFDRQLYIKSFSCLLFPTKQAEDIIFWHLLYNEDGSRISYLDPRVRKFGAVEADKIGFSEIERMRHVLGWCSNVQNHAGSHNADYNIRPSGRREPHAGCNLERFSISGGKFISVGASFAIGLKDVPLHLKRNGSYIEQIKDISSQSIVFYDVGDRRAWLVNGASALLHLVRASLEDDRHSKIGSRLLFQLDKMNRPTREYASDSAIEVLIDEHNMELPIFPHKREISEEISTEASDSPKQVSKTKETHVLLQDRVEQIYHFLEQVLTYQVDRAGRPGLETKFRPRNYLEGFDFMDVATGADPVLLKITGLQSTGKCWIDFTRAIRAVTLFGRGFGEVIRPQATSSPCGFWSQMPKDADHLAVCVSDLKSIIRRWGDWEDIPVRVVDDIRWHNPDKVFERCDCHSNSHTSCDRAQALLPSAFSFRRLANRIVSPVLGGDDDQGAIIFGHSRKLPVHWPDQSSKDPEEMPPRTILLDAEQDALETPSTTNQIISPPSVVSTSSNSQERRITQLSNGSRELASTLQSSYPTSSTETPPEVALYVSTKSQDEGGSTMRRARNYLFEKVRSSRNRKR